MYEQNLRIKCSRRILYLFCKCPIMIHFFQALGLISPHSGVYLDISCLTYNAVSGTWTPNTTITNVHFCTLLRKLKHFLLILLTSMGFRQLLSRKGWKLICKTLVVAIFYLYFETLSHTSNNARFQKSSLISIKNVNTGSMPEVLCSISSFSKYNFWQFTDYMYMYGCVACVGSRI